MKKLFASFAVVILLFTGCKPAQKFTSEEKNTLTIAIGSCNDQKLPNPLWDEVLTNKPLAWIWGGDNIYSDTSDMAKMKADYQVQMQQPGYAEVVKSMKINGTWDDHDYGLNDGGKEFAKKAEAQQLLLDFLGVEKNDNRRKHEGVYGSEDFGTDKQLVKVILLDTRYFRDGLTKADGRKRYNPNAYGQGTMLGKTQWDWLEQELNTSKAQFNVLVSSIQVLSDQHGYEAWGNMPHERDRLINLVKNTKAKGVFVISGDRHISEFSKMEAEGMKYPIIDFTSSGMTHSAENNLGEENPYRVGPLVNQKSFGLLQFNFDTNEVTMKMMGDGNVVLGELKQKF